MGDFAPSVHDVQQHGVRVVRGEYPVGVAGVKLSLEQIALRIREGALSPAVQGVAFDALLKAGFTGRGDSAGNTRARAAALLDFVKRATLYAPDPPGVEYVKSAEAMLCLRPGLCVRGGDCDDQLVLLGSMLMGVGIPVQILKQTFGYGDQEHVLVEAQDEGGQWFPLDPSSTMPSGMKARASQEFRLDPSNPSMVGLNGAPDAEFVGVGALGGGVGLGDTSGLVVGNPLPWTAGEVFLAIVAVSITAGLVAGGVHRYRKRRRR